MAATSLISSSPAPEYCPPDFLMISPGARGGGIRDDEDDCMGIWTGLEKRNEFYNHHHAEYDHLVGRVGLAKVGLVTVPAGLMMVDPGLG